MKKIEVLTIDLAKYGKLGIKISEMQANANKGMDENERITNMMFVLGHKELNYIEKMIIVQSLFDYSIMFS